MLTGENGILKRASEAKEKTELAQKEENVTLSNYEKIIDKYTSNLPSTEYTEPYLPNSTFSYKEGDLNKGLVIKDKDGNEYVWIEVPKSIYEDANYNTNGEPNSSIDYEKIERCLKVYTSDYSNQDYSDNNPVYLDLYHNMLKSVYENGGFWIGRYEAGIEKDAPRTSHIEISENAVVKQNKIPYNNITRDEAQKLAEKMNYESVMSSLIFGIQWDLMLKYIENKKIEKNPEIKKELLVDASKIGNFYNSSFTLNRGKFAQLGNTATWYNFDSENNSKLVTRKEKNLRPLG